MLTFAFISVAFCVGVHYSQSTVLERYMNRDPVCHMECTKRYNSTAELEKACIEGCRFSAMIKFANYVPSNGTSVKKICEYTCTDAFHNDSTTEACKYACGVTNPPQVEKQTLHLLTPFMYIKGAYDAMASRMRQLFSSQFEVYIQEDSEKVVVLETRPNTIIIPDSSKDESRGLSYNPALGKEGRVNWMDCLSYQSGIPRWILAVGLFSFSIALLWLCCASLATAPSQYVVQNKNFQKDEGYILLNKFDGSDPFEPYFDYEEAPPLPQKQGIA